jgi:hypothetical protein
MTLFSSLLVSSGMFRIIVISALLKSNKYLLSSLIPIQVYSWSFSPIKTHNGNIEKLVTLNI